MKQTKNALGMLLNAYRSIYKFAYFKGLAGAVIFTAGLSSTQAAELPTDASGADMNAALINVTDNTAFTQNSYAHDINVSSTGSINGATSNTFLYLSGTLNLGQNAAINLSNGAGIDDITVAPDQGSHDSVSALVAQGGNSINLSDGSYIETLRISLNDTAVTLSGNRGDSWRENASLMAAYNFASNQNEGVLTAVNTDFNMNNGSMLTARYMTIDGGSLNLNGVADSDGKNLAVVRAYGSGTTGTLDVSDADISVSGSGNIIGAVTGNFTNVDLNVATGAALYLSGNISNASDNSAYQLLSDSNISLENVSGGELSFSGGSIVNLGTIEFKGDLTLQGIALNNENGTVEINSGSLTFGSNVSQAQLDALNAISDTVSLAQNLSGTYIVPEKTQLIFDGPGVYEISDINLKASASEDKASGGKIIVQNNAIVLVDTVDTLTALGPIGLIQAENESGEEGEGTVYVTAANSTVSSALFSDQHLHNAGEDSGAHSAVEFNNLRVSGGSLTTASLELIVNGNLTLEVDANNVFTLGGGTGSVESEINAGGNVSLSDVTAAADHPGTIVLADRGEMNFAAAGAYSVNADLTLSGSGALSNFGQGTWNVQDITVNNGSLSIGDDEDEDDVAAQVSVIADTVTLASGAEGLEQSLEVLANSSLSVQTLNVAAGQGEIASNATLIVRGDNQNNTVDLSGGNNVTVNGGIVDLTDAADTVGLTFSSNGFSTSSGYSKLSMQNGTIRLDMANVSGGYTVAQANSLLSVLASGSGLVSLVNDAVDIPTETDPSTGESMVDFDKLQGDAGSTTGDLTLTFDNEETRSSVLTNVAGGVTGGWKAVKLAENADNLEVTAAGTLAVYGTTAGDKLVADAAGNTAAVNIGAGGTFTVNASGQVGAISGDDGTLSVNQSAVSVVAADGCAAADIAVAKIEQTDAHISAGDVTAADSIKLASASALQAADVATEGELSLQSDSSLNAANLQAATININASSAAVSGSVTADAINVANGGSMDASEIHVSGDMNVVGASTVTATTLSLSDGSTLRIGSEGSASESASTGSLHVENLALNGATLEIDPAFGDATAVATVQYFGQRPSTDSEDMELDGNVIVGKNSALGVGMTKDELLTGIAGYQQGGSLVDGAYGSVLMVNRTGLHIADGHSIVVGSADIATLRTKVQSDAIYFGAGGSMVLTANALSEDRATFIFEGTNGGSLVAGGGQIVVPAGTTADQIKQAFENEKSSNPIAIKTDGDYRLKFTTQNGLYVGYLEDGKTLDELQMTLGSNTRGILSGLSDATYTYAMDVLEHVQEIREDARPEGWQPGDDEPVLLGMDFIQDATGFGNGLSLETASRLAAFGGVVQSAQQAALSTTDAIAARAGIGVMSNLTVAENNGFGLWFAPIYRSQDSDGLDADGLNAGADVDLYGAALGADYAFMNTVKAGVMFNIGSGSADGQDAGSAVDNDFDYWALAAYAAINPVENLDILADISYTSVDNDVDASSGLDDYGTLSTSVDSTALSLGVTAQYRFALSTVDITPHLGLRYTMLDVDDYSVDSAAGTLADTDSDSLNVFSVPVGVKFSRDFKVNDWKISPALDLMVTGNFGDDEYDSDVTFAGVNGYEANLSTEVIDSFTYGAALGLSADHGNFALGLGVSYQGSENTDAFGLSANFGYRF